MRPVAILGIGQTIIDEQWEKIDPRYRRRCGDLCHARRRTRVGGGVFVGNMMSGIINGQTALGPLVADWAGLRAGMQ